MFTRRVLNKEFNLIRSYKQTIINCRKENTQELAIDLAKAMKLETSERKIVSKTCNND